jgi:hypothetical protein
VHTLGGLYELARMACITRANFSGKYWTWRWQTALGPQGMHGPIRGSERRRAMLEYARWVWRLRGR